MIKCWAIRHILEKGYIYECHVQFSLMIFMGYVQYYIDIFQWIIYIYICMAEILVYIRTSSWLYVFFFLKIFLDI